MRLINASTMEMEQMFPPKIEPYIILSHRWGDDEVLYQDFGNPDVVYRPSYGKIKEMAALAKHLDCNYFWVDTCCINKMDSHELSESINSMFEWYRHAKVCIAYLADVPSGSEPDVFKKSEWFDRGWTLQELIAPHTVQFYDASWTYISDKTGLREDISKKTNVPMNILANEASLADYSIACRMSWAANRVTTRIEDTAYCLLGIFQVNMPLLYGERSNAFRRLQEEIVKHSNDLTIFAWRVEEEDLQPSLSQLTDLDTSTETTAESGRSANIVVSPSEEKPGVFDGTASIPSTTKSPNFMDAHQRSRAKATGTEMSAWSSSPTSPTPTEWLCLFATSPKQFAATPSMKRFSDDSESHAHSVTNHGLFMVGNLRVVNRPSAVANSSRSSTSHYVLILGRQDETIVGIYLTKTGPNLFQRNYSLGIASIMHDDVYKLAGERVSDMYVLIDQQPADTKAAQSFRSKSVHVPSTGLCDTYVAVNDMAPAHLWDAQDRLFLRPKADPSARYDMVLAIKCAVKLRSGSGSDNDDNSENSGQPIPHQHVDFVVLCHYPRHDDAPKLSIFRESDYPKVTKMLMIRRAPNNCLLWADFEVFCPYMSDLSDNIEVDVGNDQKSCKYRISAQCKEDQVNLEYLQPHLYSILFDIQPVEDT